MKPLRLRWTCPRCDHPAGPIAQAIKMWRHLVARSRFKKAVRLWNRDVPQIKKWIEETDDGLFYWNQLVWQEIRMYIFIGDQVEKEQFHFLCKRRAFDDRMRDYLRRMLIRIGIGRNL